MNSVRVPYISKVKQFWFPYFCFESETFAYLFVGREYVTRIAWKIITFGTAIKPIIDIYNHACT